ncbi:hypothetical protein ARMSODRAFT_1023608 [Armillaria solidipes]|uniref:Uncharacterized protein n=1 Tax=Armillaria solidipes TaxID=1076256 RepID=A0A2H3AZA5_9AGAR|nr:hypothetical protein ARMSODRAFT_1023608 [Armillaria solidipes]
MKPVDVEMDGKEMGKQTATKQKNTENAKQDDGIGKEKCHADDNAGILVEDEPPSKPALPDPHTNQDDCHQVSEDETKEGENQASSVDEVPVEKQPSESRSSGLAAAASIRTEHQEIQPKPTTTKTRKRPDIQIDDGLTVTRAKRLRSGPAPKEILTLAEHAELGRGTIAAPKGPKRRARKT